ncbi:MAG TPA: SURF1 family protein [Gemmatimonadales bacterium]
MSSTRRRAVMVLMLLAAAGFARLGIWQLDRLHQRRAANVVTRAARAAPPITLTAADTDPDRLAEHRVVAQGHYDLGSDIVLRGAVLEGAPGVLVVTPLLLADSGPAVLVTRGFLPAPDAVTVDLDGLQESGRVTVRGIAKPLPSGGGEPLAHGGRTTWRRLDLAALRTRLPYDLLPVYVEQTPDSSLPPFPRRLAPAPIDEGPHLSYAIQWFLFATLAAGFGVLVVNRER